jgi:hypothetical protein
MIGRRRGIGRLRRRDDDDTTFRCSLRVTNLIQIKITRHFRTASFPSIQKQVPQFLAHSTNILVPKGAILGLDDASRVTVGREEKRRKGKNIDPLQTTYIDISIRSHSHILTVNYLCRRNRDQLPLALQ